MSVEGNKAVVALYIEMWNTGNVALADRVLAQGYVDHAHPEFAGAEAVKRAVAAVRAGDPDFRIAIDTLIGQGDAVAVEASILTTRQGQQVTSRVAWFARLVDGRMTDWRTWYAKP